MNKTHVIRNFPSKALPTLLKKRIQLAKHQGLQLPHRHSATGRKLTKTNLSCILKPLLCLPKRQPAVGRRGRICTSCTAKPLLCLLRWRTFVHLYPKISALPFKAACVCTFMPLTASLPGTIKQCLFHPNRIKVHMSLVSMLGRPNGIVLPPTQCTTKLPCIFLRRLCTANKAPLWLLPSQV
jgi:hypothetical protein